VSADTVALVLSPSLAETAVQLLEDREYSKLALMAGEVYDIQGLAEALLRQPLASAVEAHRLNDLLGRSAKTAKELEALRKSRVQPLNEEVRNVNALFKGISDGLDAFRVQGDKLLAAWNAQERARVAREQEEARRQQEEAAAREAEALAAVEAATSGAARAEAMAAAEAASREQTAAQLLMPMEAPRSLKSEHATALSREVWVFEVVDAAQVPREYLCPDEAKIAAAIKAGVRQIPGLSIAPQEKFTRRTR
jgi:hypothetical protein